MTKRSLSPKPEEQLLYVGIKNPLDVRRELLLASKDSLDLQRKIELIRNLRKEKEKHWTDLHHTFEQLIVLNKRLRSAMPRLAIPATHEMLPAPVPHAEEHHEEVRHERTRLELLEEELASIEHKLSALE